MAPRAKRPSEASPTGDAGSDWIWRRLAALLGWSVLLLAVGWAARELETRAVAARPQVTCQLEWADLPVWLAAPASEPILQQLAWFAGLRPDDDLWDPELVRRLGEGLRQSPWVADVQRITRLSDGRIRVQATYREPFAFVETGGIVYLVDASGVRLPHRHFVAYVDERYWNDWLRITGVSGPVPEEGQPWTGEDVAAGLRLVQYFKQAGARGEVPFRPALRAVDVGNFRRREDSYDGELRLRTVCPKSYVAWGLPPGEEFKIEATASRKLEMLRSYYSEHGGQFPDGWVYDVRGPDGILRWTYKGR